MEVSNLWCWTNLCNQYFLCTLTIDPTYSFFTLEKRHLNESNQERELWKSANFKYDFFISKVQQPYTTYHQFFWSVTISELKI